MIPKIIHYCWFGRNPLPPLAVKCIDSWKTFFPSYEIKEWNEDNFNVNIIPYCSEAYKEKKYAFVSDYARFWIIYNYGGLYFDTDVEVLKPFDDIIGSGAFMGCEKNDGAGVAPGLGIGAPQELPFYKEILDFYDTLSFYNPNGSLNMQTVVEYTTALLTEHGLQPINEIQTIAGVKIYPKEYFCPMDYYTKKIVKTINTRSIHYYDASWRTRRDYVIDFLIKLFGKRFLMRLKRLFSHV